MCKYTPNQLNTVEQNLMKIKAVGDLMSFAERDSGFSFPMESIQEIGYLILGWAVNSLKIINPPEYEVGADPQAAAAAAEVSDGS